MYVLDLFLILLPFLLMLFFTLLCFALVWSVFEANDFL